MKKSFLIKDTSKNKIIRSSLRSAVWRRSNLLLMRRLLKCVCLPARQVRNDGVVFRGVLNIGIIIFLTLNTLAQETKLEKIFSIDMSGSRIAADNLGYIYIISESILKKFDGDGNILYTYSELSDGKIYGVDVSDPLKIMIFNADFGKIKYLDNKLSLKKDFIVLSDLGYSNPTLVTGSYENGFWLFDPSTNQLVRFHNSLQHSQSSGSINDLTELDIAPDFMTEVNNNLYLNDPHFGILVFDRYATFIRIIPIKNLHSFQVFSSRIIYTENNQLKFFDMKTFEESAITLPEDDGIIINAILNNQRVYLLTKTKLNIYKIK